MVGTRRTRAALVAGAEDVEGAVELLRQRLARERAVKLSALKAGPLREAIAARLAAEGFELGVAFVRQPLAKQLHEALSQEEAIAVSELPERVRGASGAELAQAIDAQVARGELRRILRGRTEYVVGARHALLGNRRLAALRDTLSGLASRLDRSRERTDAGLLASDIESMLSAARRVLEESSGPPPAEHAAAVPNASRLAPALAETAPSEMTAAPEAASGDRWAALLSAVDAARDSSSGMAFVPAIVRRLSGAMPVPDALELLMWAARRELIELRPEGGLGRLSDEELSLCPSGPAGTRLSWARRRAGVAA